MSKRVRNRMMTASSRIRGLQAVTRQLPRVKSVKTETWSNQFSQTQDMGGGKLIQTEEGGAYSQCNIGKTLEYT